MSMWQREKSPDILLLGMLSHGADVCVVIRENENGEMPCERSMDAVTESAPFQKDEHNMRKGKQ